MELQILLKNKMVLLDDAEKRATTAEKRVEVLEKELAQLNHGSASSTDRDFLDAVRDTFARTPGLQEELQNLLASSRALVKEAQQVLASSRPRLWILDTENRMKAMSKEPLAHKEALCEELGLRDVDRSERMMRTLDAAAADEEVEEKDNYIAQLQTQVSKEKKAEAAE
uniref:Uncharacterized protein n=1 Tax=Palpitomonas bilix TaxID=652834 RepID=A0A7S3GBQ1_9EUKA